MNMYSLRTRRFTWLPRFWVSMYVVCLSYLGMGQGVQHTCRFLSDSLQIGIPCTLRVSIKVPPGSLLEIQDGLSDFAPYQLMEVFTRDRIRDKEMDWYIYEYVLRSFTVGGAQHISLRYAIQSDSAQTSHTLFCEALPFKSALVYTGDSVESTFQFGSERIPLETPWDFRDGFIWGFFLLMGILLFYFLFNKMWGRLNAFIQVWLDWRIFKRNWKENRATIPVPASFISSLNYAWKSYLDPDKSLYLVSLTYEELADTLQGIDTLSEMDQDILLESVQLENDIVYAEKKVPQDQLAYIWKVIFPIMKKAYEQRRKEV